MAYWLTLVNTLELMVHREEQICLGFWQVGVELGRPGFQPTSLGGAPGTSDTSEAGTSGTKNCPGAT